MLKHKNTNIFKLIIGLVSLFFILSITVYGLQKSGSTKSLSLKPTPTIYVPLKQIIDKIKSTNDVSYTIKDVDSYFSKKNRPPITEAPSIKIHNQDLLEKLISNDKNYIAIDIREKREIEKLIRLNSYLRLTYIRFGDLINNNFSPIPKNTEIIIIGFTENREIVASSYLISQGYSNVKILRGGLLQWSLDNLPTQINDYLRNGENYVLEKDIASLLKFYTKTSLKQIYPYPTILKFAPYSPESVSMLLWDTNTLKKYINSLSRKKRYILSCNSDKYCYEATYFWYIAKDTIDIIGYIHNDR